MKTLVLCTICLGSFALGSTALAQNRNRGDDEVAPVVVHRSASTAPAAPHQAVVNRQPVQRNISRAPFRTRTYVQSNGPVRYQTLGNPRVIENNPAVVRTDNINRNRNVVVTNNWRGAQFRGNQYATFRDYHRQWHDRDWWRHHYNRFTFVDGGWYYWDDGYWFPAWGYDASAYYPYDGPIYGYENLAPDQIVAQVQTQLQRDGYYPGPVDGDLGPMTRQAIADFQANNGLAVTATVDQPTLATLGLS